jgi:hypothetical protein
MNALHKLSQNTPMLLLPNPAPHMLNLIIKPIRQAQRRHQTPSINRITHPRTDNLGPTRPISPADRYKALHDRLLIKATRQQRRHPRRAQEENNVEKRIVVLRCVAFVVARTLSRGVVIFVFGIRIVEGRGGEGTGFDGGAERGLAHIPPGLGLLRNQTMLVIVCSDSRISVAVRVALGAEGEAVSGGAGGGVCDGYESDDCTDDDGCFAGAAGADERVALVVVGFHADGGEGQVGAVDGDDGGLGEARAGVDVLDGGVDGGDGGDEEED